VGGGAIAIEFAQMFRRFGSRVTMLVRSERRLRGEDEDVAEALANVLTDEGVSIRFGTSLSHVAPYRAHDVRLTVEGPGGMVGTLDATHLLMATGRVPNTEVLNLQATGVKINDHGYIVTNERLETNVPGIYALGEVAGSPQFTHISYDDFRIIKANLLEGGSRTVHDRPEPWATFSDPELGRVGLTENAARQQGRKIRVAKMPMSSVARAIETSETAGLMKAIVDAETGQILGAAILGVNGGEIMTMLQIAMMGKLPYTTLRDAVIAHPTLAESLNNLFSSFEDER
jgi:pyruvate/2-oxoglutarate dehydrogenase complex dihydrolipoamide dehydrogenase (E3) component